MGFEAWLTLGVLAWVLVALLRRTRPPDLVLMGAMVVLIIGGVLTPREGLQGFSNPQTFTLGALLILAFGVRRTGAFERLYRWALTPRSTGVSRRLGLISGISPRLLSATGRLTWVTLFLSSVVEGVGVVATFLPRVETLGRRLGVSPPQLLMPLALASMMGGSLTLIGAISTLFVNGVISSQGFEPLSLFATGLVAAPAVILGAVTLILTAPRLLPDRAGPLGDLAARQKDYLLEMALSPTSPLAGKTIRGAGLRHLPGLFLVAIERGRRRIAPVGPMERLVGGDLLTFAGSVGTLQDLRALPGLDLADGAGEASTGSLERRLVEAVISDRSPLLGLTVRGVNFRGRFNAAVVAVHRHGERLHGRLGDIELRPGDTLLLEGAPGFARSFRESEDFFLVHELEEGATVRHHQGPRVAALIWLMVAVMATGAMPIVSVAMVAAIALVALKILSVGEAREGVSPSVLVVFAATFALTAALQKTGLAEQGGGMLAALGPATALTLVYVATVTLSNLVGGIVGAGTLLPIALATAAALGLPVMPFILAVALGAALTLCSPIAHQTARMVVGPGRYGAADFLRVGLPLQIVTGIVVVGILLWRIGALGGMP